MAASLLEIQAGLEPQPSNATELIPGYWLITGLGISVAVMLVLMWDQHDRIFFSPLASWLYAIAVAVAAILHIRRRNRAPWHDVLRDFSGHFLVLLAVSLIGTIASYPAAAASVGYVDPKLERIDQALHFDWLAWYRMVSSHPILQWCGRIAYVSIYVTPAVLLGYFAYHRRRSEARLFLVNFWIAAMLTLLLFPWLPAKGPLAVLWRGHIPYMPASALYESQMIPELRTHVLSQVDLGALRGLVCAPSFHTTAALLFCFTAWPVRTLRWPLLALNVAMLLSTPVEGTHYLADMLGGALVAVVSTLITTGVARKLKARDAARNVAAGVALS